MSDLPAFISIHRLHLLNSRKSWTTVDHTEGGKVIGLPHGKGEVALQPIAECSHGMQFSLSDFGGVVCPEKLFVSILRMSVRIQ